MRASATTSICRSAGAPSARRPCRRRSDRSARFSLIPRGRPSRLRRFDMADRILVTGGCGFIGTEIVQQLVARGYAVRVADNLSKPYSRIPPGCEFVRADLARDGEADRVFEGVRA